MKVVKISDIEAVAITDPIFTGKVNDQCPIVESEKELRLRVVNYSPGTVTKFHTHTFNQVFYVTEGRGIIATENEEITVTPGSFIFIPAGEKNWHGATKDSTFSYIVINAR